jgi:hypothetical protein
MRARLIKPGFFKNEELARLAPLARLLYAGLWTLADRDGRLEDRPARIRIELFPYDPIADAELEALLAALERAAFIRRYVADGRRVILIPTFLEHQKPHVREAASTLPHPPRPAEGAPKANLGAAEATPRRPVFDLDPVPGTDPVSDPVSVSVPVSDPVSAAPVENVWKSGGNVAILALARRALDFVTTPAACSHEELVDTVQWYARQKQIALTAAQARDAIAIVLATPEARP